MRLDRRIRQGKKSGARRVNPGRAAAQRPVCLPPRAGHVPNDPAIAAPRRARLAQDAAAPPPSPQDSGRLPPGEKSGSRESYVLVGTKDASVRANSSRPTCAARAVGETARAARGVRRGFLRTLNRPTGGRPAGAPSEDVPSTIRDEAAERSREDPCQPTPPQRIATLNHILRRRNLNTKHPILRVFSLSANPANLPLPSEDDGGVDEWSEYDATRTLGQ